MSVDRFRGKYISFSNTYPLDVPIYTDYGLSVPTSEHAYMANRFLDKDIHRDVANARCDMSNMKGKITYRDAVESKRLAHYYIDQGAELINGSDSERVSMMKRVVRSKLIANRAILNLLFDTNDEYIAEGNNWGDQFWGVDLYSGYGQNNLGHIFMELRSSLYSEYSQ